MRSASARAGRVPMALPARCDGGKSMATDRVADPTHPGRSEGTVTVPTQAPHGKTRQSSLLRSREPRWAPQLAGSLSPSTCSTTSLMSR
jgi:hypothetical protein